MLLHIPQVLSKQEVAHIRTELAAHEWNDGAHSSGAQAASRKHNLQLSLQAPVYASLAKQVAAALARHPLFASAVLPRQILPPMFNCYSGGGRYGNHVDSAMQRDSLGDPVRTDVSTTLFLSEPEEYEGGELIVEDTYGEHEIKLEAGDAIIYPATSLHRVEPVTAGARIASFLWSQSLVRDAWQRKMLFDLDMNILKLRQQLGDSDEVVGLTSTYHNLLRQWAQ
jgi:PKHD-type hydroxylase